MLKKLENITLIGLDCVNIDRALLSFKICEHYCDFQEKILLTHFINYDQVTETNIKLIKIDPVLSLSQYSFFVIKELGKYIKTDFMLIVQYDGFILNPNAWSTDFLKYDYIGAPWAYNTHNVGNGGFSLRSKKLSDFIQKDPLIEKRLYIKKGFRGILLEDDVICREFREYLEDNGFTFAPNEVARQFSFEGKRGKPSVWDGQFGFHSLKRTNLTKWKDKNLFF